MSHNTIIWDWILLMKFCLIWQVSNAFALDFLTSSERSVKQTETVAELWQKPGKQNHRFSHGGICGSFVVSAEDTRNTTYQFLNEETVSHFSLRKLRFSPTHILIWEWAPHSLPAFPVSMTYFVGWMLQGLLGEGVIRIWDNEASGRTASWLSYAT